MNCEHCEDTKLVTSGQYDDIANVPCVCTLEANDPEHETEAN